MQGAGACFETKARGHGVGRLDNLMQQKMRPVLRSGRLDFLSDEGDVEARAFDGDFFYPRPGAALALDEAVFGE